MFEIKHVSLCLAMIPTHPTQKVLKLAQMKGCRCETGPDEQWQIHSPLRFESWQLVQRGDRWLLLVHRSPQISFTPDEAIRFILRRLQSVEESTIRVSG